MFLKEIFFERMNFMIRKMMRSLCLMVTAIFMVELVAVSGAMAATPETMQDKLVAVEKAAYGEAQTGALLDRVSRLEKDFTKSQPNESVMKRVDDIYEKMFMNDLGPSLITQMNAIEYGLTQEVSMKSIQERVNDMEMTLAGKTSEGPYIKRIETLAGYAFGGIEPALQSMAVHIAPPERRGSANSTFLCAYDIGLGGGGGLAGLLISAAGYRDMFLILSLATVASVLLYVLWGRHHKSSFTHK